MRRVMLAVILALAAGADVLAFGHKDQGMVTPDKVFVFKTPKFYPAVDVHVHINATPECFDLAVKSMDAAGVAASVNVSGGSGERLDKALKLAAKYPGRFVTFCGVGFRGDEWKAPDIGERIAKTLQESHDKGAAGFGETVKWALHGRINWDDPRLEPMWNKLEELKMPINWHVSDPSRYWRPESPTNTLESDGYYKGFPLKQELLFQQERVLEKHPNLFVIAAHSNYLTDEIPYLVYRFEKYPNYYIDLAAACDEFGRVPEEFVDLCAKYSNRMLYGTDAGYRGGRIADPAGAEKAVQAFKAFQVAHFLFLGTDQKMIPIPFNGNYGHHLVGWENGFTRYANDGVALPDEVLRKIYYENFERLFDVKVSAWQPPAGFTYEISLPKPEPEERGFGSTDSALRRRPGPSSDSALTQGAPR